MYFKSKCSNIPFSSPEVQLKLIGTCSLWNQRSPLFAMFLTVFCNLGELSGRQPPMQWSCVKPKGLNSEPFLYRKAWESSRTSCVISMNKNNDVPIKCFRKTVLCVISFVKTVVLSGAVNQAFPNDAKGKLNRENCKLVANLFKSHLNTMHQ